MLGLDSFLEQAKEHLVSTVESHKLAFGKSFVDQKMLVPEEYQDLVWFLFPSEVVAELLQLKKGTETSFDALRAFALQ